MENGQRVQYRRSKRGGEYQGKIVDQRSPEGESVYVAWDFGMVRRESKAELETVREEHDGQTFCVRG